MTLPNRRALNLGIVLIGLGLFFLVRRVFHVHGPGPILLVIGTILFVVAAVRDFRGPLLPAGVLLGLGAGFLLRDPLEAWMPRWATILLGLGSGFLLAAAVGRSAGRGWHPVPLVPGAILVGIAVVAAIGENLRIRDTAYELAGRLWPWALVAAGAILIAQALRKRGVRP